MKQLHIREPWASLAYKSTDQVLQDLIARIQVLEARVRELEQELTIELPQTPAVVEGSITGREVVTAGV